MYWLLSAYVYHLLTFKSTCINKVFRNVNMCMYIIHVELFQFFFTFLFQCLIMIRDGDGDLVEAVKSKNISNVMMQRTFQVSIVFFYI